MKTKSLYLFMAVLAFFFSSCGSTATQELVSESADKSGQVKIKGKRDTSLDPFQTSIVINGFGQTDTLVTEIYAKDLNSETVLFEWTGNADCIVTFLQQDDSKRIMNVSFGAEGNSLEEGK